MIKIKNFFKSAGRFLKSILPAFIFFEAILFSVSMPVLASATSNGFITDKNPSSGTVYNGDYTKYYSQSKALEQIEYDDKLFMHLYDYLCAYSVLYSIPDIGSASPTVQDFLAELARHFQCTGPLVSMPLVVQPISLSGLRLVSYDDSKDKVRNGELCHLFNELKPIKAEGSYLCYLRNKIFYFLLDDGDIFMVTPDCRGGFASSGDFVVASSTFNEEVQAANTLYYPKNATGKMSYRTDSRFHNYTLSSYYFWETFYSQGTGFIPVGGGNEMYALYFYKTDTDTYYSKLQLHFVITENEVWYEDRDEIEHIDRTLILEYWDMIDGSQKESTSVVLMDDASYGYLELTTTNLASLSVSAYDKYENYIAYKERRYNSTNLYISDLSILFKPDMSLSIDYNARNSTLFRHFTSPYSAHDSNCSFNGLCDFGYVASATPISAVYDIDTSRIPDDHYITVNGDTIYDYSITNPVTGDTTTIRNYVTNNYNFPPKDDNGNGGTSGNVTVSGQIDVSGTVSVDVNVDVNINGGGGGGNHYEMPDTSFFDDYLDDALEESSGIRKFIADFFDSMPGQITKLIGIGLVLAILCRLIGR